MYSHERKWLRRLAILNDYVRIPYANGSSYASQFLYREMTARGHEVTIVGPDDPNAKPSELPPRHISLPSIPLRNHPGVYLAMPSRSSLETLGEANFDMLLVQSPSGLLYAGGWLRQQHGVPLVSVNTVHMPSVYNVVLPDSLNHVPSVNRLFSQRVVPWVEENTTDAYNVGDALVCLSPGLKRYWEDRGVEVPIHVIPRAIERRIFDKTGQEDPFPREAAPGARLLVVCRHAREKQVDRLIRLFAKYVHPRVEGATLTMVGDGPEHEALKDLAKDLGVEQSTHFVGEQGLAQMPAWYRHADLFVYTSLSETYGQVVSEALWCGLPVVAMDDGKGVAGQVTDGEDGFLVDPTDEEADRQYAGHLELLLTKPTLRRRMSGLAVRNAKDRSDPDACVTRYLEVFEIARDHARSSNRGSQKIQAYRNLARWVGMHATAGALGLMRRPVELNRNQAVTGSWTFAKAS
ncbi:MAG: glycosyltransferase [Deltaproteobacteria bacterium]|nr:glycosyltransferase [Deltaproteobacteria bacterium]